MAHQDYQIYATDTLVPRNREGRIAVFALWIVLITLITTSVSGKITSDWFGYWWPGFFIGLAAAASIITYSLPRFLVQVGALRAFVTIDQLRTFFGKHTGAEDEHAYVIYGPGVHVSYPWESREANRNVPLEEVSENFKVDVQTPKGNLEVEGSVRLRPDITRVIPFLGGVAVMANDITDLIKSHIISYVATKVTDKKTIQDALSSVSDLTTYLTVEFGKSTTVFEERFGVSVGDVTISRMMPSKELQKTMTGLSEAEIISNGAAAILGYSSIKSARTAIRAGRLTQEDLNRARDRFMAASDNIKMNLDANEITFKVEGLDPETVQSLAKAAPAIATALTRGKQNRKEK